VHIPDEPIHTAGRVYRHFVAELGHVCKQMAIGFGVVDEAS